MFDKDGNGSISRLELKEMFETAEKKDEELWNQIFSEVDINNDGNISYEEFKECMMKVVEASRRNKASQKFAKQNSKTHAWELTTADGN